MYWGVPIIVLMLILYKVFGRKAEHTEQETKNPTMEDAEIINTNVNVCVMCGAVIPEGLLVCKKCRDEVMGENEQI